MHRSHYILRINCILEPQFELLFVSSLVMVLWTFLNPNFNDRFLVEVLWTVFSDILWISFENLLNLIQGLFLVIMIDFWQQHFTHYGVTYRLFSVFFVEKRFLGDFSKSIARTFCGGVVHVTVAVYLKILSQEKATISSAFVSISCCCRR